MKTKEFSIHDYIADEGYNGYESKDVNNLWPTRCLTYIEFHSVLGPIQENMEDDEDSGSESGVSEYSTDKSSAYDCDISPMQPKGGCDRHMYVSRTCAACQERLRSGSNGKSKSGKLYKNCAHSCGCCEGKGSCSMCRSSSWGGSANGNHRLQDNCNKPLINKTGPKSHHKLKELCAKKMSSRRPVCDHSSCCAERDVTSCSPTNQTSQKCDHVRLSMEDGEDLKEEFKGKKLVMLVALMGLGMIFVGAIVLWVFSPAIF